MDATRFDRLARALGVSGGRRALLGAALAAALAAFGARGEGEAAHGVRAGGKRRERRDPGRGRGAIQAEKKRKKKKCKPKCTGKVCGPSGCKSGTCGTCSVATRCNAAGQCVGCFSRGDCAPLACNSVVCGPTGTCVYTPIANGSICGTQNDICCGGQCIDKTSDEAHCGACGAACGDDACHGGLCCTVCAGGGCPHSTVQAAIDAAAAGATIRICPGAYDGRSVMDTNVTLVGMGASADDTLLRNAQASIVDVRTGATVTVRNLTVTGATSGDAGAVSNSGTLTLEAVKIVDNTTTLTTSTGGGISNGGTISLVDCLVSGNAGLQGGAMRNVGQATLVRTTMEFNVALQGGGVSNESAGTVLRITQASRIRLNQATAGAGFGGGVFNGAAAVTVDATSKILGNSPDNCVNALGGTGCPA